MSQQYQEVPRIPRGQGQMKGREGQRPRKSPEHEVGYLVVMMAEPMPSQLPHYIHTENWPVA